MLKLSREVLLERTTDAEVFQNMDNFELLNDSSAFALSLRLQFPKFSKGFTSSDFEPFVRSHVGEKNLVSLGRLSFPNEWQMQVTNKEIRETLIRMGRTKINTRTCWISPLSQSEVRGYIHWLPTAISNRKLEALLRDYGEVLLMESQKQNKWICKVESDSRYFGLYLKSGKTMDDVPHFIRVDDYHGLITIRGRNPACFHCKEIGHRKSECKKYREAVSDYSLRPPHSGKPRLKPRGKRHNGKKDVGPKSMDQEVQTGEEVITCEECLRELLAKQNLLASSAEHVVAEAGGQLVSAVGTSEQQNSVAEVSEQLNSAAEISEELASGANVSEQLNSEAEVSEELASGANVSEQLVSGAEESKPLDSAAEASEQLVSATKVCEQLISEDETKEQVSSAAEVNVPSSGVAIESKQTDCDSEPFNLSAAARKKNKKNKIEEEFYAKLEKLRSDLNPIDLKKLLEDEAAARSNKIKQPDSNKMNSASNPTSMETDKQAVVQKTGVAVPKPIDQLEQLRRNVEEVLAKTRETLEIEFEISRQMLIKESEKSAQAAGEGKKRRRKKKKKKSVVPNEEL